MDSEVLAFELQDDKTVNKTSVSLTFPRPNNQSLYIITNQKSKCHLLQDPNDKKSLEKNLEKKKIFQYGGSSKVFSVTGPTGSEWEVRLLLSPSEISRLSTGFNLIGCLSIYLVSPESHQDFQDLFHGKKSTNAAEKICRMITPFLCLPEGDVADDYRAQLTEMVTTNIRPSCKDLPGKGATMVARGLAALMAAELAASFVASNTFDYPGEKMEGKEDLKEKISQMVKMFDVQAELLEVSHQGKSVTIIFRNPCPDNWASGGRKCSESKESIEFGLCHKVFSISRLQSDIQFLQSLQESYDMIAVFHIAAFAEHLLMTKKWRKTLDALLNEDQKKETINELSQFAAKFVCSKKRTEKSFLKCFKKEMRETLSKVKTLQAGGEAIPVFGLLVAILAAFKAKAIADTPDDDISSSSDDETDKPVVSESQSSEEAHDSKVDLQSSQQVVHSKPETIGPNLKVNDETGNEEAETGNTGEISKDSTDVLVDGNVGHSEKANTECNETDSSKTPEVGASDTGTSSPHSDDDSQPCPTGKPSNEQLDSNDKAISPVLKGKDETGNEEAETGNTGGISKDSDDDLGDGNVDHSEKANTECNETDSSKTPEVGASDTGTSSPHSDDDSHPCPTGKPSDEQLDSNNDCPVSGIDMEPSPLETQSTGESQSVEESQGSPEFTSKIDTSGTCKHGRQDPDDLNGNHSGSSAESTCSETSVGHVDDPDSGSRTTYDEDTTNNRTPEPETIGPNLKENGDTGNKKAATGNTGGISRDGLGDGNVHHTEKADSGSRTTYDEEKTIHQDTQITHSRGKESLTSSPQKDPSTQRSEETKKSDTDQPGQRQDLPSDVDQGGEETSNRPVAQSSFSMLLIILIAALVIASFVLPVEWTSVLFTVMALMLGVYLFLGRRP